MNQVDYDTIISLYKECGLKYSTNNQIRTTINTGNLNCTGKGGYIGGNQPVIHSRYSEESILNQK